MDTTENGPEVVDSALVAGVTIPPGTGSLLRPARRSLSEAQTFAPTEAQDTHVVETGPETAYAAPQAADAAPAEALSAPEAAAVPEASTAPILPAAPVFVGLRERQRAIPLGWPIFYGGKLYEAIVVSRPSTKAVADYYDLMRGLPDGEVGPRFPVFFHADGSPVPDVVLDALDDDDGTNVFGAVDDFLPVRLKLLRAEPEDASTPPTGDDTGPKSSA